MLSARLQAVFDYVPKDAKVVDIGTDHAYLPIELVKSKKAKSVIAVDNLKSPLEVAEKNIKQEQLDRQIQCVLSDGLTKVNGDYDCLTIAGLGGNTIIEILEKAQNQLNNVDNIIIQANNGIEQVRRYLVSIGYIISAEKLVYENDIYYEIMHFIKGSAEYSDLEYSYGPLLFKDPLLVEKIQEEIKHDTYILKKIPTTEVKKRAEFEAKIKQALDLIAKL